MPDAPWYRDGLKFKCTQCGDCCTGAAGFVWVNAEEIAAMAQTTGHTIAEFEEKFVRKVGVRKTLTERENGDCILLDAKTKKCTVYNDRPRQCRTWPFWESNIRTPEAWKDCCEECPGSGHGQLYSLETIQAQAAVIKI